MDIAKLRYFVDICESKNISQTAARHYISRQALSKTMIKLENEIGVPLLLRKKTGISLTPEGAIFHDCAREILYAFDGALEKIHTLHSNRREILHVGYGHMSGNLWKANHVHHFMTKQPSIEVQAQVMLPDQLLEALENETLDIAVTSAVGNENHFVNLPLVQLPLCVLMDKNDPLAEKDVVSLQDISSRNILLQPGHSQFIEQLILFFQQEGVAMEYHRSLSHDLTSIVRMVREYGMLYFTTGIFTQFVDIQKELSIRLFVHTDSESFPAKNIYAIIRRSEERKPEIQKYIQYLRAEKVMPTPLSNGK